MIKPFEKPEFTLKAFLEVQKVNVNMPTFRQPKRNKPDISVNVKSDFKIRTFKTPETTVADLPQIRKADVEIGSFQPPVQPKLDIKLNTVPDVEVKGFEKPEFEAVKLPVIRKPDVSHIEFHAPENGRSSFLLSQNQVLMSSHLKSRRILRQSCLSFRK